MRFPAVVRFCLVFAFVSGCVSVISGCASSNANGKARKIEDMNEAALGDLQAGKPRRAQKALQAALEEVAKQKLQQHPVAARTHMNLGVVLAAGLNQRSRAVKEMAAALAIAPNLEPPSNFRSPQVDKAFATAKARSGQQDAAAPVAAPAPAPAPEPVPQPEVAASEGQGTRGKRGRRRKNKPAEAPAAAEPAAPPAAPAEPPPVVPETPPASASASAEEAALPVPLPETIYCPLPDRVPPGQSIAVWCGVDPGLRARGASLFVRPSDQAEFTKLPMKRSERGWYVGAIEAGLVKGSLLQFYVEAENGGGTRLAATGDAYSPNVLLVQARARPVPPVLTQGALDGDEPEPDLLPTEPQADPVSRAGFDWSRTWVGLQAGTGWGWHAESALEFRQDITLPSGTTGAGLVHILPELGYQLSQRWSVSLQTRHQILPNEGDTGGRPGRPARAAHAALVRGIYTMPLASRWSLQGSGAIGGGEGFRMVIDPVANRGRSGTDSIRGGPILIGAGAGLLFGVTPRFGLVAELRALLGAPDLAVLGEFNLGARYAFGAGAP